MSDEEEYVFIIGLDGKVKIEVHGVVGESCVSATARVVKSLNGKLGNVVVEKTEEYHALAGGAKARGRAR